MLFVDVSVGTAGLKVRRDLNRYVEQEDITKEKVLRPIMLFENGKAGDIIGVVSEMRKSRGETDVESVYGSIE